MLTTPDCVPVAALISKPCAVNDDNDTDFGDRGCCAVLDRHGNAKRLANTTVANRRVARNPRRLGMRRLVMSQFRELVLRASSADQFCGSGAIPSSLAKPATAARCSSMDCANSSGPPTLRI